ncbi:MAG: hypothetical protein U0893_25380 [Chloroflexota bacterium]
MAAAASGNRRRRRVSLLGSDGLQRLRLLVALVLVMALSLPDWRPGLAQDADPCPEPNDDIATACPLPEGVVIRSTLSQPSDRDVFRIVADPGVELIGVELFDLPADYDLYLSDARGRVLGQSVHEGTTSEDLRIGVQPGTYYATVQADTSRIVDPAQPYSLRLTLVRKAAAPAAPPGAPDASSSPSSASAPAPPAPAPSSPDSRPVLLADDFDDPMHAAFPTTSFMPGQVEVGYVDGEYSLRNIDPLNGSRGTGTQAVYGDASLVFDVRMVGDASGRSISVGCRVTTIEAAPIRARLSFYNLVIFPDARSFNVIRYDAGVPAQPYGRQFSSAIRPDNEWNRLELSCVGSTVTARANGIDLSTMQDDTHKRGTFFIVIGGPASAMPHPEARLDNLVIYGP